MDLSRTPLRDLERRLGDPARRRAPRGLLVALEGDDRSGARRLAERWLRRREALARERRRVGALFALRRRLCETGARYVAGVDEVGMGPMAGPVVATAVVLGERPDLPGLDDSKKLTRPARERLDAAIREQAVAIGVAEVWPQEIERLNVYRAGLEAMRRAVVALDPAADHVLVDARRVPGITAPQTPIVHGDAEDGSIAAASVVAKVYRDALMRELAQRYPGYGFEVHKGYCTAAHRDALRRLGPSPVHRRSFAPVSQLSLLG